MKLLHSAGSTPRRKTKEKDDEYEAMARKYALNKHQQYAFLRLPKFAPFKGTKEVPAEKPDIGRPNSRRASLTAGGESRIVKSSKTNTTKCSKFWLENRSRASSEVK